MNVVLADVIELLDRQVAFLLKQQGAEFFVQLPAFLEALRTDPRLDAVIEDMLSDMVQKLKSVNDRRATVKDSLIALGAQIVAAYPALDDSQAPRAIPGDPGWHEYRDSLAYFDALAANTGVAWPNHRQVDQDRDAIDVMLGILATKLHVVDPESEELQAQPLRIALGNIERQFEHVRRDYDLATMTSAPVAALRLIVLARELNPDPRVLSEPMTLPELLRGTFDELYGVGGRIREYVFPLRSSRKQNGIEAIEGSIRQDVERFHEEARRRLGLKRSLRGLVDRYAARAMWHDAAMLRKLARTPRKAEDLLTADFARYLHDQGLSPLTKPMTGGLQPDLLAPMPHWTFYAEAKQYANGRARSYLIKGVHQVWDTLGRLRGTPYEVREAFYVVFRLGGPRFV